MTLRRIKASVAVPVELFDDRAVRLHTATRKLRLKRNQKPGGERAGEDDSNGLSSAVRGHAVRSTRTDVAPVPCCYDGVTPAFLDWAARGRTTVVFTDLSHTRRPTGVGGTVRARELSPLSPNGQDQEDGLRDQEHEVEQAEQPIGQAGC